MKLHAKKILILVSEGVNLDELYAMKLGFEAEYATTYLTSLQGGRRVRGIGNHGNEEWVYTDFPLEMILPTHYDAIAVPGGVLSIDLLRKDKGVQKILTDFHAALKPILISDHARVLLYESGVFPENVLVYSSEMQEMDQFVRDSCELLIEGSLPSVRLRKDLQSRPIYRQP
jgi:protease I